MIANILRVTLVAIVLGSVVSCVTTVEQPVDEEPIEEVQVEELPEFPDAGAELELAENQSIGLYLDPQYGSLVHGQLVAIESIPGTSIYPVYASLENEEYRQSGVVIYTPETEYRFTMFFELFFGGASKQEIDGRIQSDGMGLTEVSIGSYRFLVFEAASVEDVVSALEDDAEIRERVRGFLRSILSRG